MKLSELRAILESLEELSVNSEIFSFGPAYSAANERQRKAINLIRKEISKTQEPRENTDWWQDMENSTKGW